MKKFLCIFFILNPLFLYSQPWILIGDEKYIERAIIKINHFCELSIDILMIFLILYTIFIIL